MEDVSSLRVTIGLDTSAFSDGIKSLNRQLRAVKSEFSFADDGTKTWRNSLEGLTAKSENLTRQLEVQRLKVETLKRQYEEQAAALGENSKEAQNLLTQYNTAAGVMRRMETSLEQTNRRINEQSSEFGQLRRQVNSDVESMDRELRVLNSGMQDVNATMGHSHGAAGQMGASLEQLRTRNNQLNQSVGIQQRRLSELQNLLQATTREEGQNSRAAQEMRIRYNEAAQALNRTQSEMHQVHGQIQTQSSAWGRLGQALGGSMSQLGMIGMNLQMTGMNIAMTFGAATTAVAGALGSAVKASIDFGSQMSKVGAIAGASGKDLDRLKESALDLGAKTSLSASQVAEAMTEMAAKGYTTNQIISAMPGVISAAEASGEDLSMVADTVSSALNSFGLAASDSTHIADVLAKAANDSAAGVEDMQYAFKYAAPPAHALGMSLEELSAAAEIMANSGIKGETAGTTLRMALLRLIDPPKAAANTLHNLGVNIKDSQNNMLPFSNIIGQLNDKTSKLSKAQKAAALSAIFGKEAVSGMLSIVSAGPQKIDELTNSLKNSDGASEKAAKKMKDNLGGALEQLKGSFESAQIAIGDALTPAIKKIASSIKGITDAFNKLSPEMKKFIAIGGAVSAILLGVVTAFGVIMMAVGGVISAWGTISAATAALGLSFTALTGPIGLTVAAIGILGIAAYGAKKAIDESKQVNLDHAKSMIEQKNQMQELSTQYQTLRDKNKLSNDELLRYRDLQAELKTAKSDQEVKTLTGAMELLQQKSGLSNEELNKMLNLNDQIVKKTPEVKQAYSERGNSIISNKDALNEANAKLAENIRLELENQKIKAEAKLDQDIRNYISALDELKAKENERNNAMKDRKQLEQEITNMQKTQQDLFDRGQDGAARALETQIMNKKQQLQIQNNTVAALANEVSEQQKSVEKSDEQIAKTQKLFDQLINVELAQVGINAKGAEGISQLDQAIQKTQTRINELNAAKQSQGGLNAEQQKELENLQSALGKYQNTKSEIQNIQTEQQSVNNKIDQATGKAGNMNKELGKNVDKNVKVDDKGKTDEINEKAGRTISKSISISTIWHGLTAGIKKALGFASGTNFAPGGWSLVGEEGPELMYVPRGAQIKTANQTSKLLNNTSSSSVPASNTFNFERMMEGATFVIREEADVKKVAKELHDLTRSAARGKGVIMS